MSSTPATANYGNKVLYVGGLQADTIDAKTVNISSSDTSFVPPRMTTAQRLLVDGGNPPEGAVVYDTDVETLYLRTSSSWEPVNTPSTKSFASLQFDTDFNITTTTIITTQYDSAATLAQNISIDYTTGIISLVAGRTYLINFSLTLSDFASAQFIAVNAIKSDSTDVISTARMLFQTGTTSSMTQFPNLLVDTRSDSTNANFRLQFTYSSEIYEVDADNCYIHITEI